jgi:cob(I)alamin adenosyltransferase
MWKSISYLAILWNMTRIYTRKGDDGSTEVLSGKRVKKNDPLIHALGELDSCNAAIGMALALFPAGFLPELQKQLTEIQNTLFDWGAYVANPEQSSFKIQQINTDGVKSLEHWIDEMDGKLPPLHAFILPGGYPAAAALHVARCSCREAERFLSELDLKESAPFLNRLSDYLFVAARFVNQSMQRQEVVWKHT